MMMSTRIGVNVHQEVEDMAERIMEMGVPENQVLSLILYAVGWSIGVSSSFSSTKEVSDCREAISCFISLGINDGINYDSKD